MGPESRTPALSDARETARLLVAWHDADQRDLPWRPSRAGTRDPYGVLVSEIMLQQTRVEVVVDYFRRWMERFPTLETLAAAELDDVLRQWEGLGYYARARNLHRTARMLVREFGGHFPRERSALLKLPGIGPYSAGAILSMAYGQPEPILDGNVTRVLARLTDLDAPIESTATHKILWSLATELVGGAEAGDAGALNEAVMELGATVCTPRAPRCLLCPVALQCRARMAGTQESRPVTKPRKATPHFDVAAGVIWQGAQGASPVLIAQRPLEGLLGGLWEFPGGKAEESDADLPATLRREIREELAVDIEVGGEVTVVTHAFTHFRITLHAFHARIVAGQPQPIGCAAWRWVELSALGGYAMGVVDRRISELLLQELHGDATAIG